MKSSHHHDPFHITPDQVHLNITLPTTTFVHQAFFVHPDVTAVLVHHIDTTTTTTNEGSTIPDTHHHNRYSASTAFLANLLTAPLRINVQACSPTTTTGSGIHCCFVDDDEGAALFSQSEAGLLIRGLVCQRLRLLRTFSATMLQDPQGRFTVNVDVRIFAVKQQQVKVHDLHVDMPLEEDSHPLVINDINANNEREKQPSDTHGNIEEVTISVRERRLKEESEMLGALGPMWLPDGDTFRHSRSQQVPVSEAILEKLGFVVGSMSLVRPPLPSASILPSAGWNGDDDDVMTASSQCGQSVVSDDEDDHHGPDFFDGYYNA